MDWNHLAQESDWWKVVLCTLMAFIFPLNTGNLFVRYSFLVCHQELGSMVVDIVEQNNLTLD
jgi:hypothetical protein